LFIPLKVFNIVDHNNRLEIFILASVIVEIDVKSLNLASAYFTTDAKNVF